jgi:hypothetical protein
MFEEPIRTRSHGPANVTDLSGVRETRRMRSYLCLMLGLKTCPDLSNRERPERS